MQRLHEIRERIRDDPPSVYKDVALWLLESPATGRLIRFRIEPALGLPSTDKKMARLAASGSTASRCATLVLRAESKQAKQTQTWRGRH